MVELKFMASRIEVSDIGQCKGVSGQGLHKTKPLIYIPSTFMLGFCRLKLCEIFWKPNLEI